MSALERLAAHCEAETAAIIGKFGLSHYRGTDWCMITDEEGEALGIELADMPMVVAAYDAYFTIAGVCRSPSFAQNLIDDLRVELVWIEHGIVEEEIFIRLAGLLGVRASAASGFYRKQRLADLVIAKRIEVLPFEPPARRKTSIGSRDCGDPDDDLIPF